jgi:hypothetical protein
MRTRFGWLVILSLLILVFNGCGSSGGDWSDTFLKNMYLGTVQVKSGDTVNVPLASTSSIRFEFNRPVTAESLNRLLSFSIIIENLRNHQYIRVTEDDLTANGDLFWIGDSKTIVEYHLTHPLTYIICGCPGLVYDLLSVPGDTFRITVQNMVGEAEDGTQFAFLDDEFYVIWTGSGPIDTGEEPWSDNILANFYLGDVLVKSGTTANVPFMSTSIMRFDLDEPVSEASLTQDFDYEIWIENVDTGTTFYLTETNLDANGELVWLDGSNQAIEYRLNHSLDFFWSGGQKVYLGNPGDTFRVTLINLSGRAQNGGLFSLQGDEFTLVWAAN